MEKPRSKATIERLQTAANTNHYENFVKLIQTTLKREKSFSKLVLKIVDADIAATLMATSNSSTFGQSNSSRQDR